MKVAFYTLGCKVNQYESQAMAEDFKKNGHEIVKSDENADVYIVNSCTVTSSGDKKTRQAVRRFKRNNSQSVVVLTGCMPQAYPEKSLIIDDADIVIGNKNNDKLIELLNDYFENNDRLIKIEPHLNDDPFRGNTITTFDERTRAFVKIQDGCNRFCSYCIIPYSRGRVCSKLLAEIKSEIEALAQNGYKEVVLVGINLSSYGTDIQESFFDAIKTACEISKIERVRLGSLEPDHIDRALLEKLSTLPKFCPQFHISLQSGCDETLKRMNRHYDTQKFRELCDDIRKTFDNATITTDVMVGFPLESDEDFQTSLEFVKEIKFEKVHVFPYSIREGTKAASLPQISKAVKESRAHVMIEETEKIRANFLKQQIGKIYSIIIESTTDDDLKVGYTTNYIPIHVKCTESKIGESIKTKITDSKNDYCIGETI